MGKRSNLSKKQKTNQSSVSLEKEDAEIKYYERKLGMKLKTSKNEFTKDGLDDLLDFCEDRSDNLLDFELNDEKPEEIRQSDFQSSSKKSNKNKRKIEREESEDDFSDQSDDKLDKDELDVKRESEQNEFKPSTTKWVSKRLLENKRKFEQEQSKRKSKEETDDDLDIFDEEDELNESDIGESDNDESYNDESDDETKKKLNDFKQQKTETLREDIYGRSIDANGNVIKEEIKRSLNEDNQIEKELTKKVRGLLNKITLKTLPFIVTELEIVFQKHSNNLVCKCLFNCINHLVIKDQIMASQKLCTELAMLIAICHSRIGEEVSANILHQLVKTLDEMFDLLRNETSNNFSNNKEFENLLLMICSIYGVNIISDELIYNILEKLNEIFNSKSIELILFCLKLVGFLLRKDNTSMMKNFILNVQQKANQFDKEKINEKKVMFMLNALTSIKNNVNLKMDLSDIQSIVPINKQTIKSDLKSLFKDINVNCLRGKYNEILKSNRWFVHSGELLEISMKRKMEKQKAISLPTLSDKLCKKLQLTTPFRKLVFNTIFTCEDYIDCSQNIIKLTKKDHFEVILICLHIFLNEKQFNPFYVHLFRYLAHIDRNYKRGILFNLREKIKNMTDLNGKQLTNLESLIIDLIKIHVLPLMVFEVIDFKDMTELYKSFMCNIFESLFKCDLDLIDQIFKKLSEKSQLSTSIKVFINVFLSDECKIKFKQMKQGIRTNKIF